MLMRLIKNIICLTVLMVFTLFHTQISFAADSEWYWIAQMINIVNIFL